MLTRETHGQHAVTLNRVWLSENSNPRNAFSTFDEASLSPRLRLPMD
jgi:hypothetical protein